MSGLKSEQDNLYQLENDQYNYQLAICSNFSADIKTSVPDACTHSGACQSSLVSTHRNYSLGLANSQLIYSNGSLKLIYEDGASGCSRKRATEVSFVCALMQENKSGLREVSLTK